jgi:hypothetical protein
MVDVSGNEVFSVLMMCMSNHMLGRYTEVVLVCEREQVGK